MATTSGTPTHNFLVHIPGEQGRSVLGGRLKLTLGVAFLRTPFLILDVITANTQSEGNTPTESPLVYPFEEAGAKWVRFTCGDESVDTVHYTIWGRQ